MKRIGIFLLLLCLMLPQARAEQQTAQWHFGFAKHQMIPDAQSGQPLYIAGYQSGAEITGVLDYCQARALWLDAGGQGILLIGVDCVGLDSGTVGQIRSALSDLENCMSVQVYSTHTHAGIDTLGLWGPVGVSGKNDAYMESLIRAAEAAGREAAENRKSGNLYFGMTQTENMYRDSRGPQVYDENLYQLRFSASDGSAGARLLFYGAHAESLRGENTLLSRDFPGLLCDGLKEKTGDEAMYLPGAIGGLIMTKEFVDVSSRAVENMQITADKLLDYALSISPEDEILLAPRMRLATKEFSIPLDNSAFLLYKFLGILGTRAVRAESATGYGVATELSVLMLDDTAVVMVPGEIFPELVYGGSYGKANHKGKNPRTFVEIAADFGVSRLLIVGLANDEIGYIVPPSDFLLNPDFPYLSRTLDYKGEDHYEETNSVGPACALCIARALEAAFSALP